MKVLLISGKAGSGKDTIAKMFADNISKNHKHVLITHYADLLKYILTKYFDWDGKKDEEGREKLQYIGTDIIRTQIPNFWVGFVAQILELFPNQWDIVIIPDCRFPNEISFMKDKGFNVSHIEVVRPGVDSNLTEGQQQHSSETALDGISADFTVINSGTKEEMAEIIAKLCNAYGEHYE